MAPGLLRQNPSFRSPFDEAPESPQSPAEQRETVWDWWDRNGDAATDILQTGLCAVWPNRPECSPQTRPTPAISQAQQNNLMMWVAIAIMALVLLFLIFKK